MPRWFLSYHSPDEEIANALRAAIERRDAGAHVFFAPASMRAGGSWTAQLANEIAAADAFILLIGNRIGPWQLLEYDEALDRWANARGSWPLIVALIEGNTAPGLPFLRRLHWIITPDPASDADVARLFAAVAGAGETPAELWRYATPYRGLTAMTEEDSDYFFGRTQQTIDVIQQLAAPGRLPVLIGNSGVGKSSLARAGVLAALKRQAWPEGAGSADKPWPHVLQGSRQWCFLTLRPGTEPIRALVKAFVDTWQFPGTDPERAERQNRWVKLLLDGNSSLTDLMDATEERRQELGQSKPAAFFLYVDQGEELYVLADEDQRGRFSQILAQGIANPRLRAMMSLRSDFLGRLQNDLPLFHLRQQIDVGPLDETGLRKVVSRPAELLGARFEPPSLVDIIARRTAEDSVKAVGALPLLSYTLDDMWTQMLERHDRKEGEPGRLQLSAQAFDLAGVLVTRANAFLASHPGEESTLRRVLTLRCATVREDGEPTRRRAVRSEFADEEWRIVSELANYPNRLLVIVTPEGGGEAFAEVAHEAIFWRWDKLKDWIAAEREFLAWRNGLEAARRAWEAEERKDYALLMGVGLAKAQNWRARRSDDLAAPDRDFIDRSAARETRLQRRARLIQTLTYVLMGLVIIGLVGWINQAVLADQWSWYRTLLPYAQQQIRPHVLTAKAELQLKAGQPFRECADAKICPDMVVVPAGRFVMGGPTADFAMRLHEVTIPKAYAVSKFEVTFEQWDTCVKLGWCTELSDYGFGRGTRPVINANWNDAKRYVEWLSRMTGQRYRLLTEAEYEHATRAGTTSKFYWGDTLGTGHANCKNCGTQWSGKQTAPVGSFPANGFGLYDMTGNVWEWVEDCWHETFDGAPTSGSAWLTGGDCRLRVVRGGGWYDDEPQSATRYRGVIGGGIIYCGFRVAREIAARAE
jgi:formylglycine-generating enzyme required for sulfatase activity